jgi:sugar phosphate permease
MATEDFGPSFYLLCVVAFLSMLSVMIPNPVLSIFTMGILADRIERKPVLLFGIAATSVLVAVMSVFTSLTIISVIIAVIGFIKGPNGS